MHVRGGRNLQVFELQFQLFDLTEHLLALRPEKQPLQLLYQQLQPFDLSGTRVQPNGVALQLRGMGCLLRQKHRLQRRVIKTVEISWLEGVQHARSMPRERCN